MIPALSNANLTRLHPDLPKVLECIDAAGGRPYLVGGSVRDALMGTDPEDLDIEVFGAPMEKLEQELIRLFKVHWVGKSFGVLKVGGHPFDISVPREETVTGPGHRDFDIRCDPELPLEKAAARRDFTINAIYWDLQEEALVDPHGGLEDIRRRTLRHTSDKFAEDSLRVFRAMQFAARFGFEVHPSTVALSASMSPDNLPRERVFGEFRKLILKGIRPSIGLNFLRDCGWIRIFPELKALIGCDQDPHWHPEGDVWNHTLLCMDAFADARTGDPAEDLIVGLAVLCHDMGKPVTSVDDDGRIRSPGHAEAGVPATLSFLSRLTEETVLLEAIPPLVAAHMRPAALYRDKSSDAAIRRLALQVGRMDRLLRVCQADRRGRTGAVASEAFPEGDWITGRLSNLGLEKQKPRPIVQGRDLIQMGLSPSQAFSPLLDDCFQAQLDGVFEDHPGGLKFLQTLLSNKGLLPNTGA